MYVLGFILWLAYGFALGNTALVGANSVSLVVGRRRSRSRFDFALAGLR